MYVKRYHTRIVMIGLPEYIVFYIYYTQPISLIYFIWITVVHNDSRTSV
jgi:hypothetical protein